MADVETKHDKFKRIREQRISKLTEDIDKLVNFTNGQYYEYSDWEVDEMVNTLRKHINSLETSLRNRNKQLFTLQDDITGEEVKRPVTVKTIRSGINMYDFVIRTTEDGIEIPVIIDQVVARVLFPMEEIKPLVRALKEIWELDET